MTQPRRKIDKDRFGELSDDSIRCRVYRHVWKPYDAKKVLGAFETTEVCERCKSQRHSTIGNVGDIRSRRIDYSDNFLSTHGRLEADDVGALRLITIGWDYNL